MTSSVASAAAHATTLPPYVPPCAPGAQRASVARGARTPDSGSPDAMPLAITMMSGVTPQCSHRPEAAGAAEAGLDLVRDEQDAVLVGQLPQARQEPGRRHDVAALADDRLDDEGGDPPGVDQLGEQGRHGGLPVVPQRLVITATAVRIGIRRVVHGARQRLEVAPDGDPRGGQRHRLCRAAVEAAAERHDDRPTGRDARELDRRLDRLRAAVAQERAPVRAGCQLGETGVQPQAGLVVDDVLLAVEQLHRLRRDGRR